MISNRIRLGFISLAIFVVVAFHGSAHLTAQTSSQGAITGTVTDPSGAVIGNAAVTIQSKETNAISKTTTDASGFFNVPLLDPGDYKVTITAAGFANYTADNVVIVVGQVTSLLPHLALASSSAEVVVTEQDPVINTSSPDFTSSIDQKALANIPVNNRRWSALALTTPGIVADTSGFGLISVRGISTLLNNVEIDGADDNNAMWGEERGRTREAYSTSGMAVREFAVNTGVYAAEYGRAAGGVVTSVTKSGTNQIHGVAYFFDRESNWNAFNDFTTLTKANYTSGDPIPTSFTTSPFKPEDLRKIYGFTVGGPLIKDKLFWIYTYDQHTHINPGVGVPSVSNTTTGFYATPNATTTGTCNTTTGYLSGDTNATDESACTLAAREGLSSYAAGASAYSAGIASLLPDLGLVPRDGYQEINTPKIDWQVNQKTRASFLYHRLRWDAPGDVQTNTTADYAIDTWGTDFVKLDYGLAKLDSVITPSISNEVLYQYGRELEDEGQQPLSAYDKANLVGTSGNVPEVALDTSIGFNLGIPYYSYRTAYPRETKWQVGDSVYWVHHNHTFKFGVDIVNNNDFTNVLNNDPNGYYSYNYIGNYFADVYSHLNGKATDSCNSTGAQFGTATTSAVGTYQCYSEYQQSYGPPVFAISTMDYGYYGQDNWQLNPRLTLELGLRYDYESLPAPPIPITAIPQTANHPSDKNNFGPRVGFSYNVFSDNKTVLRGGFGMYYGRIPNSLILLTYQNSGNLTGGQYTTNFFPTAGATSSTGALLPYLYPSAGSAPVPGILFLASNLQNPMVYEYDLALQQEVGRGTVFSLSYLGGLGRELPNFVDVNLDPTTAETVTATVSDAAGKGPLPNGAQYQEKVYTKYGNAALFGAAGSSYQGIVEVESNINSNYNAMVAEIQNRTLHHLQFDANYTWSHALDFNQNATTTISGTTENWLDPYANARTNYGNSSWNIPNRFVAYAIYTFPGINSKGWARYLVNDWSLDDSFQMGNGLPYSGQVKSAKPVTAAASTGWYGSGTGASYIPVLGRDTYSYPRHIVDDVRLSKAIAITEGRNLELMVNLFNIANHQNIDGINNTEYAFTAVNATNTTLTYQPSFGAITSSNNSGFLYTPRQIEIAAKFTF
jgi:Carboxypeptidase regulatory-like domain/TonB-dependent Receptor Plug Domain